MGGPFRKKVKNFFELQGCIKSAFLFSQSYPTIPNGLSQNSEKLACSFGINLVILYHFTS